MRLGVPLPREHGAWAMILVPFLVGAAAAKETNGRIALLFVSLLFLFLARAPLVLLIKGRNSQGQPEARAWLTLYAALGLGFGGALLLAFRLWVLLPLGGVAAVIGSLYLLQVARRAEMSVAGELLGVAGLALGAPAAYITATGRLDISALALWALNALYFGGSAFYVKFRVREKPRQPATGSWRERLAQGKATIIYHLVALGTMTTFAAFGVVPFLAPLAFLPVTCKAFLGVLARPGRLNIKRIGLAEMAHSGVFAALLLLAFRWT